MITRIIPPFALCLLVGLSESSRAQIYETNNVVVQTFAGSAFVGYVDGVGQLTMFNYPSSIVADSAGNLFVWDNNNRRIRKLAPDATVSTFAGGGVFGTGCGTNAYLPYDSAFMAIDHSNNLWFTTSPYLFRISSDACVSYTALSGVNYNSGICVDSVNNVYYSGDSKIYRYKTNGVLEVFAGSGNSGSIDGNGIFTSFSNPQAMACDAADNIYVWDAGSFMLRRINQNRDVVTIAGKDSSSVDGAPTNASFNSIKAMCVDGPGNLILACVSSIRKLTASTNASTFAGVFSSYGYTNGPGNLARFGNASGVCISQGTIFVADQNNHRIRSITFNPSAQPVLPANLHLYSYAGLQIDGTVGRTYQVQSSPDMSNWVTRATLLLTSTPYIWLDQNPIAGNKFYRALLLP